MSDNTERNTGNGNLMEPWKPGQSGNPNGRPKGAKEGLDARIRRLLRKGAPIDIKKIIEKYGYEVEDPTYADAVAIVTMHQALQGESWAVKELRAADTEDQEGLVPYGDKGGLNINVVLAPGQTSEKKEPETKPIEVNGIPLKDYVRRSGNNGSTSQHHDS